MANKEDINKEEIKVDEKANLDNSKEEKSENLEEILEDVEVVEEEEESNKEDTVSDELANLRRENIKLNNELDELKDRLLRLNAEYDNFRKRTSKEKEGIYTDACVDVLGEMIPVLDNLERALQVEGSCDDLKKGVEMTQRQFNSALEKLGVTEIDTDGNFDPNYHNAVMHIQDENLDTNCIAEVFQKGYKKGEKVIRHSMVKVAN